MLKRQVRVCCDGDDCEKYTNGWVRYSPLVQELNVDIEVKGPWKVLPVLPEPICRCGDCQDEKFLAVYEHYKNHPKYDSIAEERYRLIEYQRSKLEGLYNDVLHAKEHPNTPVDED